MTWTKTGPGARGIAIAAAICCLAGCRQGGIEWYEGTLEDALEEASGRSTHLVVTVTAGWCPACHEMEREFWNTRHGRRVGRHYVALEVDHDGPQGERIVRRYHVMHLPTTLVLDAGGNELGRIVGYEGTTQVRAELGAIAVRGEPALGEIAKRAAARPEDLQLGIQHGEALLAAGIEQKGVSVLERVLDRDPENEAGAFVDATRILARYFIRCRDEYYRGRMYLEEAVRRFPEADAVWELHYWVGLSWWEAGDDPRARQYFAKLVEDHPDDARAHGLRARFHQLEDPNLEIALESASRACELDPDDDWYHYLKAEILWAKGQEDEAREALGRALEIAPDEAIYLDREEQWAGE